MSNDDDIVNNRTTTTMTIANDDTVDTTIGQCCNTAQCDYMANAVPYREVHPQESRRSKHTTCERLRLE